jgi:hypothetical protein
MRCFVAAFLVLPAILAGCGGSSSSSLGNSPTSYPALSGNWSIALIPSNPLAFEPELGGYITNTGGAVSGTLHAVDSSCFTAAQDIAISGSVTPEGSITITSAAVSGQTISFTGFTGPSNAPARDPLVLIGSYSITGGCAGGQSGTILGNVVPPLTGTFSGTFESVSGLSIPVTISVIQSAANSDGEYTVSGAATFTGSPCFSAGTITSSVLFGENLQATITTDKSGVLQFTSIGILLSSTSSSGITILGEYKVTAGSCAGDTGSGTLANQ